MSKMIEMEGQKIGKLLVLGYAGSKFRGRASRASWHCRCDCGREPSPTPRSHWPCS
jgi:hypothetical protein